MKRLFIILSTILLSCTVASAQQKGDKYFGGMAGIIMEASDGGFGLGFAVQPEFGGFVADNCKLGASIGYSLTNGMHILTVAPNFAYYVRLCDGMYYTPGIEAGFVMAISGGAYPGLGVTLNMFSLEFRPTKHFGFTANLASLNFFVLANAGRAATFNLGVNPTVGVKYYF
jgi:hypothetical protein